MDEYPKLKLSKLDTARRQLDCALELWFLDKDEVSVHTLVAAAHQIFHDLHQKQGGPGIAGTGLLFDSIIIKDEHREEFVEFMRAPANFLKHADRDPDGTLEFAPFISMLFLGFSVFSLESFGFSPNDIEHCFILYLCLHHPTWISEEYRKRLVEAVPIKRFIEIGKLDKRELFESYMEAMGRP